MDAFSPRPLARAKLILGGILEESKHPDIIFLQEVTSDVRTYLLGNPKVREAFLVTDAEDQTSFEGGAFANTILLSSKRFAFDLESQKEKFICGPVSRVKLPSKYGRCALSVDIFPPSTTFTPSVPATAYRLVNVHLDSLGDALPYRTQQMEILANLLRESGCGGGLIAGDFNAISPEDHALLDKNGLVDAWIALHGKKGLDGGTWGVGVKRNHGLGPRRLDKVAMLGVETKNMEILRPGLIEVPKPSEDSVYIPWSGHSGLKLDFTLRVP